MAYLMSDAAAGSNAAMTMMQNMGGAPLAADVGQAKAEQVIAEAQKAKLSTLVAEAGFQASQDSKAKLQELAKSPDFIAADDAQKLRMAASIQMQAGDVENGSKTLVASETFDAKKVATAQKLLDQQAQEIGNAYGVISAVPDDQVEQFVSRLPESTRKILEDKVGAENWASMPPAAKKEATKNLMLNAKGQMATQVKLIELQKQELLNQSRERIAFIRENAITSRRLAGGDDRDMRDWNIYTRAQENIERSGRKTLEKLDAEVEAADAAQQKSKIGVFFDSSKPSAETEDTYMKAVAKRDEFKRNQIQKELNLALSAPEFPGKASVVDNLVTELELYGVSTKPGKDKPKVEAKPTAPSKPKEEPTAKPVTSNTYTESNPAKPTTEQEYNKLPAGSYYMQDGVLKRKKG